MNETRRELISKYEFVFDGVSTGDIELNDWELNFINDNDISTAIYAEDGFLTEKQIEKIEQIYEKYDK